MTHQSTQTRYGRQIPPKLTRNTELIRRRLNAGLSIKELANRSGVSANTLRAAEEGFFIGITAQKQICDGLKEPVIFNVFPEERQREFQPKKKGRRA